MSFRKKPLPEQLFNMYRVLVTRLRGFQLRMPVLYKIEISECIWLGITVFAEQFSLIRNFSERSS